MKYGLEHEFFVQDSSGSFICLTPERGIPADDCLLLAESRGEPAGNIVDAVHNLMASNYRLDKLVTEKGFSLVQVNCATIPRITHREALRGIRAKGPSLFKNLYGHLEDVKEDRNVVNAAIHVSFTNERVLTYMEHTQGASTGRQREQKFNTLWDYVQMFRHLDEAFKEEISGANRLPGFYEIKEDGRIEYRSLPATTSLEKIIEVITAYRA